MCRIGVDLGGTNIKVGIVDAEYRLSDYVVCKTNVKFGAESVVREIVLQVYGILSKNNISESEVIGVGIGCPDWYTVGRELCCIQITSVGRITR